MSEARFGLLLITDGWDAATTPARVEAALAVLPAGAAAVQLRAKALSARALYEAAQALRPLTRARGAALVVNDRADVARAAGADGVHLPASGLPAAAARAWLGREALLGVSTHDLGEAEAAWAGGADYVTFGPVFATPSKAGMGEPVGLAALAAAVQAARGPVFALGGIDGARLAAVTATGARVACIGAVLGRADAAAGARALLDARALLSAGAIR